MACKKCGKSCFGRVCSTCRWGVPEPCIDCGGPRYPNSKQPLRCTNCFKNYVENRRKEQAEQAALMRAEREQEREAKRLEVEAQKRERVEAKRLAEEAKRQAEIEAERKRKDELRAKWMTAQAKEEAKRRAALRAEQLKDRSYLPIEDEPQVSGFTSVLARCGFLRQKKDAA
jgi:hypothetical protein